MAETYYKGEIESALARARKALRAAGFEMSKTIGRYSPFGGQFTTNGVKVTRIGCSESVHVHAHLGKYGKVEAIRDVEAKAIEALRTAGLPFDGGGRLDCFQTCYKCGEGAALHSRYVTHKTHPNPHK